MIGYNQDPHFGLAALQQRNRIKLRTLAPVVALSVLHLRSTSRFAQAESTMPQRICMPYGASIQSLTTKPIEPTPSTLKADLAVFVNSNMLITKVIGKNAQWLSVSSKSASKFPIDASFPIDATTLKRRIGKNGQVRF